jgi:hypothetical protein
MTSPSWPVRVRVPLPGISVTSVSISSPPTWVNARPDAAPTSGTFSRFCSR